ncbi:MAG: DUF885 domain-containing protein, partial [Gemmatimonadaceae bacterium]|nr:DUF885 domain-containing protein [Gemmatimonadaceae bacterium]
LAELVLLNDSLRALRQPRATNGVPDYSPAAESRWRRGLDALARRHAAMRTVDWPIPDRVDHALVGTQLAAFDFDLRVLRPWARDPGHWVDLIARTPFAELPQQSSGRDRLVAQLRAVPAILDEARRRLAAPSAELTGVALFHLERSDEVNQGEPRRPRPPAGVIGWYEDLLTRARTHDAPLVPDAEQALAAVRAFRDWLRTEQPRMTASAAVGLDDYIWYVRHVRLVPWDVAQVRLIGEREIARARTLLAIERHRNRALPPLVPAATAEEHERRTRTAETWIRDFTTRERLLTIPAEIPPQYETDAFFIDRAPWGGHRHFWDEITYRDPLNNHIHASIPGHRFDGTLQRSNPRPIRRTFSDGTRAEGWAFYIEEMYLQAGLLADRPRTRELFYIAQLKRAARVHAELRMQDGTWSLQQAIDYLNAEVPLMEENLARYDLAIYLRRPAYGMNYTIGKAQMEQLLADRQRQLGDRFVLGAFHDEFLAKGSIPISLIRWEMTGLDDEMRALGIVR